MPSIREKNIAISSKFGAGSALWTARLLRLGCLLVVLIGAGRVVSTYRIFTQTYDESAHIACGMELLSDHRYRYEAAHPPLARVAAALPLYLNGMRSLHNPDMWTEGNALLDSGDYQHNLELARLGVLPFFLLACLTVYLWAMRIADLTTAFVALLIFTTTPPVLAHAGIAATDMAATAAVSGAVLAMSYWLDGTTLRRSIGFGAVLGLAAITKFSVLPFFVICAAIILIVRRDKLPRKSPKAMACVALAGLVVMWAGYGFTLGSVFEGHAKAVSKLLAGGDAKHAIYRVLSVPLPLGQVPAGLATLAHHVGSSHAAYLLGKTSARGFHLFFPIAVAVKTPIPTLVLFLVSVGILWKNRRFVNRERWLPALMATAILLSCVPSRFNIGVRHVLPIYPMMAITAAMGCASLLRLKLRWKPLGIGLVIALLGWQVYSSVGAHPDYLAYFNELAGGHGDRVLVDSDLDWGQDLGRLSAWCREHHVEHLSVAYFGRANLAKRGLPAFDRLQPFENAHGIVAISETKLKLGTDDAEKFPQRGPGGYRWLERYQPVAMAGKSIRIYVIP